MPVDNTTLPVGAGGDTIRTLDKTGTGAPKTEVVALDVGGGDGRGENILSFPVPTSPDLPLDDDGIPTITLSQTSIDALESVLRQLIAALTTPLALTGPGPALSVAVGVTSVAALAANVNRKGLVITNASSGGQVVSLALNGAAAVANAGIVLQPGNWWWMERAEYTAGPVTAIASAAGGTVAIQEFS